jgi:hypothetical protein
MRTVLIVLQSGQASIYIYIYVSPGHYTGHVDMPLTNQSITPRT